MIPAPSLKTLFSKILLSRLKGVYSPLDQAKGRFIPPV
jgi:hypothetical protein